MKKLLQDENDARKFLVDWVPLFDRDYRYTLNYTAYKIMAWVLGMGFIIVGLLIFISMELPYMSWRQADVQSKVVTESRCLRNSNDNGTEYTFRYKYLVDGKMYLSEKAYCDAVVNSQGLIFNPKSPAESVPKSTANLGGIVIILGVIIILVSYIGTVISKKYHRWLER